jgi:hypothetical protein
LSSRPTSKSGAPKNPTDLLREVEKFSSRAIEQLAIIKEANIIVSLSAYQVSLHDLQTYELVETLTRTKNASCFAVTSNIVKDAATGIPEIISRLAVAVKRRLLLWNWHESELGDEVNEIVLPEAIRSVTWTTATKLVCGMNAGYVLVDIDSSSITEINGSGAAAAAGQGTRFGAASMGYMGLGGYMPKPLAAKLADGQMLLAKDINTLFIDAEGKPLEKRQIPWQSAPENIGYSYPYILALQPPSKGSLEVRNPDTSSLLQTINLPGAAQLHIPPPTVSLAHAGKGFHISSDRAVWKMDATDYDSQITELTDQKKYDEAISVLNMLEDALLKDKTGTMREIKMLKAEVLFKAKKYRDSMDVFNEDEVHAPPERVLKLFPRMIAGDLSSEAKQEDSTPETDDEDQADEPNDEETKDNGEKQTTEAASLAAQAVSPTKAGGFSRYWPMAGGHKKTDSDTASISSKQGPSGADKDGDTTSISSKKPEPAMADDATFEGQDLMEAVRELNSYLAGTRARLQRILDPSTGKLKRQSSSTTSDTRLTTYSEDPFKSTQSDGSFLIDTSKVDSDKELEDSLKATFTLVDTTLFRAYMYSQPKLAGSLFRIPNFCDPKVVNEKLLESNRYGELVDFFYGKKLHREALTLLRRFGTAPEDTNGHGLDETSKEKKGIVQWLKPKLKSSEDTNLEDHGENNTHDGGDTNGDAETIPINPHEIPPELRGTRRTIMYLQSMPPGLIDLILEFADWVLRLDPDAGMEIFLADSENAETLPRERVVKYLGGIDVALEIKYLEHIIDELGDATLDFHDRLIALMISKLRGETDGETHNGDMMERLIRFLRESRQYSLTRAHGLIPRDGRSSDSVLFVLPTDKSTDARFYEARAVVLSNMGQHKQALDIYVFQMQDYAKAEEYEQISQLMISSLTGVPRYCNRVHKSQLDSPAPGSPTSPNFSRDPRPASSQGQSSESLDQDDPDSAPSIYHTLLSIYLRPPPPHTPNLAPALELLSKHGSRLPAVSSLSLIPDDLPVSKLESYFGGRIRAANSKLAETRVMEGMRRALLVDTQALLLLGDGIPGGQGGRNRRVVVGEERVCGVCHKRLGNGGVVGVLPDNGVVHYGCLGRSGMATNTAGGGRTVAGAWGRSS